MAGINFKITADNSDAEKKVKESKSSLEKLGEAATKTAGKIAKWGAAAVAAAAVASAAMASASLSAAEANHAAIKNMNEYNRVSAAATANAARFNKELSTVDLRNMTNAKAATEDVGAMLSSAASNLTAEFAPAIQYGAELVLEFAEYLNSIGLTSQSVFNFVKAGIVQVATAIENIRNISTAVYNGFKATLAAMADAAISLAMTVTEALDAIPGVDMSDSLESLRGLLVKVREFGGEAAMAVSTAFDSSGEAAQSVESFFSNAEKRAATSGARITQAQTDAINTQLNAIRQFVMTEDEIAAEKRDRDLAALQLGYEQKLLSETEFLDTKAKLQAKYDAEEKARAKELADSILAIEREKEQARHAILGGALSGLTSLMNARSKEMFEVGKGAAYSQAVVSTYAGATKALELGWPLGPIAATAIAASGWANVRAISATSYQKGGAGGGGGGASTGTPTANLSEQAAPVTQRNISISVAGDSVGRGQVRELIGRIGEELGDNVNLNMV